MLILVVVGIIKTLKKKMRSKEYKQAILIRTDLKMKKGKIASQASHASVEAVLKSDPFSVKHWRNQGMKKIVLKVASKSELFKYKQKAEDSNLITAVIQDAGKTQINSGTYTALAIGPDKEEKIDEIISDLKLL